MVRKFGVELEVETYSRHGDTARDFLSRLVAEPLSRLGVGVRNSGYSHRVVDYWKVVPDGTNGYMSEYVSPPMKGRHGEKQLKAVCRMLNRTNRANANDVKISADCGVHVHLDVMGAAWAPDFWNEGMTIMEVRQRSPKMKRITNRLLETYRHFDPGLRQILPNSRHTNYFCKQFEGGLTPDEWFDRVRPNANRGVERYYRINFANCVAKYGTFEFRAHAGSMNATKIMQWTRLCQKFLTFSYAPEWAHVNPLDYPPNLDGMIACLQLPRAQADFWRTRAENLGNYSPMVPEPTPMVVTLPNVRMTVGRRDEEEQELTADELRELTEMEILTSTGGGGITSDEEQRWRDESRA